MTRRSFAVTWDYRCPFARVAHDHVLTALAAGAPWDVRFVPMSQLQCSLDDDAPSVWENPGRDRGLPALEVGIAVRDHWPEAFPAVHRGLFDARHLDARRLDDPRALAEVVTSAGLDAAEVLDVVAGGGPHATVRAEHQRAVDEHGVWGVPTFVVGAEAAFVRLMDGPAGDATTAVTTIERILDLIGGWPGLNELKHTRVPR